MAEGTRVDFYHLTRDPPPRGAAMLAERVFAAGERLLIVSADAAQRAAISNALWSAGPTSFLAHDDASGAHPERQPILIGEALQADNGARFALIADGAWRAESLDFARVFFLFTDPVIDTARRAWASLKDASEIDRHYWKQQDGRWVEAG